MTTHDWPSEWLRGVLEVAVLTSLLDGPSYGYAIAGRLAQAGYGDIKGGTLYPLLGRLEAAGHVTTEWRAGEGGPGRKFFVLTASGRRHARELAASWIAFADVTATFIHTSQEDLT